MASLNSLEVRQANERGIIGQSADAASEVIRLKYVGTGTVTSVTLTTATTLVLITTDGLTDSYAMNTTYATLGALVDAINADGIFEARIINGLRSTTSASSMTGAPTTYTIGTDGYYSLLSLATNKFLAYRLAYDRIRTSAGATKISAGHRVHILETTHLGTLGGGADANGLKIYQYNPIDRTETILWQATPTSGSATTINWASGEGRITGDDGCELVVYFSDGTSITGGLLTVVGIIE